MLAITLHKKSTCYFLKSQNGEKFMYSSTMTSVVQTANGQLLAVPTPTAGPLALPLQTTVPQVQQVSLVPQAALLPAAPVPQTPVGAQAVAATGQASVAPPAQSAVVSPVSYSTHMEVVWHGEFERLFSQFAPQQWFLLPTYQPPKNIVPWNIFTDSAKVRFSCSNCGHGWTSMKGRVAFWFHFDQTANAGCVLFKLYGQQCQKCQPEDFEHAMWYPEEVCKVIANIYHRVGQVYYGFYVAPIRIDRRGGKPRNQHNKELCQACKDGVCREWAASS